MRTDFFLVTHALKVKLFSVELHEDLPKFSARCRLLSYLYNFVFPHVFSLSAA